MTKIRPTPDELREAYSAGRMAEVRRRFGVGVTTGWRWCRDAGVKTTKKTISYDESVFDVIDTELKAYVLGLIVSDGYVVEGPKRYVINLGSTDREIPMAFAKLVGFGNEIYEIPGDGKKRLSTEYRISVCSKRLVTAIVKLGVRQRKSMKEKPVYLMNRTLDVHFLRGVFDGDGSIGLYGENRNAMWSIVGSKAICKYASDVIFMEMGVRFKPRLKTDNGLWVVGCRGNNIVKAVCKIVYKNANFFLPRKKLIADSIPPARQWVTRNFGRKI